ncbi:uncharacterized protein ATNIH1004_003989 [Aspergillus tanneri]|uniref:Uncharacterized protein n=1 Tax=Aspergillus tanneri TaxID=1220188 RepID=A0A5M9MQC1_9EURO|nr:uncharacterized protein ATNIH1004_003989 [Aspergillus tanneri]KAA8648106.1 hypothetical protein ATNIH1004_003989 [Aspergillus tanneri]
MQLSCKDFDNPKVAGAVNPHPDYSYFHSPIPNPNPTWRPHPDPRTPVTTADNKNALTPGSRLSDAILQLMATKYVASLFAATSGTPIPVPLLIPSAPTFPRLSALQTWRTARYVKEPGEGPMYSIIQDYCNFLKQLAQEDNNFAQQFGTEFHRPVYDPGIYSTYSLRMLIFPRGWHKSSPLPSKPPTPLSAPKRKRAPPKKGHKATGSRKQPARAKKDAAESVPETA